ncbi:TetR family transcriptional regulator C-terminal domain-containing protein [Streptomyces sp. NPDC029080]|uniref:TetR family transcriptional regulator C-terminal domain-containing protein n=1 Tax=Streptomyces sp. NPDC029080 TaxID=3155017 RepID=UPI0033F65637
MGESGEAGEPEGEPSVGRAGVGEPEGESSVGRAGVGGFEGEPSVGRAGGGESDGEPLAERAGGRGLGGRSAAGRGGPGEFDGEPSAGLGEVREFGNRSPAGRAGAEKIDRPVPAAPLAGTPTRRLARFLARTSGEEYDAISRLWINARHLSRYRPVLRDRVAEQETAWRDRLEALIRDGVTTGEFGTDDPRATAIQILVVLDGLGVHANTATPQRPAAVLRMPVTTAERELGLPPGTLDHPTG